MLILQADEFDAGAFSLGSKERIEVSISTAADGVPITIPVSLITGRSRQPRVAMVAGVHGDEYEGPQALAELARELAPETLDGTVLIVPVANRPAYNAGTRVNPIDGINLNRVFPGDPKGSLTERLAYGLFHHILAGAVHVADLHSAGTRCIHLPLAGFYDVPGPLGDASLAGARAWGFEYLWSTPHRAGVLSYEAIRAGIPATGGEVGGQGMCRDEDVSLYKKAMLNLLGHLGILPATARWQPTNQRALAADWLPAPASGLVRTRVRLGQWIQQHELLLTLHDIYGDVIAEVRAPWAGVVAGLRTFSTISEGDWAVSLLREEVMPSMER